MTRGGVNFVTRLKVSASYGVVECQPVAEGSSVLRDEVILLVSRQELGQKARLRRIEVRVEEKNWRHEPFVCGWQRRKLV